MPVLMVCVRQSRGPTRDVRVLCVPWEPPPAYPRPSPVSSHFISSPCTNTITTPTTLLTMPASSPAVDVSRREDLRWIRQAASHRERSLSKRSDPESSPQSEPASLHNLPYDLLLNISQYLAARDVESLLLTCKSLYDFATTRSVGHQLAMELLRRCRALPLTGFQRISDLNPTQLLSAVRRASRFEAAWKYGTPKPIRHAEGESWYRIVNSPSNEDIDWISPITSSYTLCATKSGKVVCWDIHSNECLAEWSPGEKWELWKCRVEFEERSVYFTMAKMVPLSDDRARITEFTLMRLDFPEEPSPNGGPPMLLKKPEFHHVADFKTAGAVMNVFLLDPPSRLLSAFIWVEQSNTIGLYVLPDWSKNEYVFLDSGLQCQMTSNWSCILYKDQVVIHCEEADTAIQLFYPISLLKSNIRTLPSKTSTPIIQGHVAPDKILSKKFVFPDIPGINTPPLNSGIFTPDSGFEGDVEIDDETNGEADDTGSVAEDLVSMVSSSDTDSIIEASASDPNPFPFPPWYPESAHFVRQWWPSLPDVPRVSCAVVLLASHDPRTHHTHYVLAQHYFRIPIRNPDWLSTRMGNLNRAERIAHDGIDSVAAREAADDDRLLRLWFITTPFEVVSITDTHPDDDIDGAGERPRPLVAVDFGHAVWIEYEVDDPNVNRQPGDPSPKRLRFVTFPVVGEPEDDQPLVDQEVRTLEVPDELDLNKVDTINIDQSQGAIILSVNGDRSGEGKIFILSYE